MLDRKCIEKSAEEANEENREENFRCSDYTAFTYARVHVYILL